MRIQAPLRSSHLQQYPLAGLWLQTLAGDLTLEGKLAFPNILGTVTASSKVVICLCQALPLPTCVSLSNTYDNIYLNIVNIIIIIIIIIIIMGPGWCDSVD